MNQVRITLHVMADSRGDAFTLARAAIECLYEGGSGCASGPTGYGTYRADIETITVPYDDETITVPYDDETEPPFGPHIPHPVTAAEAGS